MGRRLLWLYVSIALVASSVLGLTAPTVGRGCEVRGTWPLLFADDLSLIHRRCAAVGIRCHVSLAKSLSPKLALHVHGASPKAVAPAEIEALLTDYHARAKERLLASSHLAFLAALAVLAGVRSAPVFPLRLAGMLLPLVGTLVAVQQPWLRITRFGIPLLFVGYAGLAVTVLLAIAALRPYAAASRVISAWAPFVALLGQIAMLVSSPKGCLGCFLFGIGCVAALASAATPKKDLFGAPSYHSATNVTTASSLLCILTCLIGFAFIARRTPPVTPDVAPLEGKVVSLPTGFAMADGQYQLLIVESSSCPACAQALVDLRSKRIPYATIPLDGVVANGARVNPSLLPTPTLLLVDRMGTVAVERHGWPRTSSERTRLLANLRAALRPTTEHQ